jgi:flagellar biosynthesis GTPase FlhF
MREGQNHVEPVLSRPQAIAVADQHPHLNRAQKSVIEDVLSSPDRIQGIQGFAGAGKTTTLPPSAALLNLRAIRSRASPRPPAPHAN